MIHQTRPKSGKIEKSWEIFSLSFGRVRERQRAGKKRRIRLGERERERGYRMRK